ncbi:proteoglycan 4-like [Sinocyclocheilus grahami]|uniref:proteoglycan 4-like n=1 Tax=Sinocyclocheilus grahami TaxID=75366 RepID=UPI0007ACA28D|nr:PREDICTED: proteoglycan 4-like [Sinocyclocheilus grahami]
MSKEGDRQSVLRTTKVRTALKGDSSWIQRQQQENLEKDEEEKPWVAEVRANRSNGVFEETSPVSSPTPDVPQPRSDTEKPKTSESGYLIRGVFKRTDSKPTSNSSTNGYAGINSFTKKPSESYKKIAPHTIRSSNEKTVQSEPTLSPEEMEKRTEAASSVLKGSAAYRRSYVMSAAKKYESSEKPDSSAEMGICFVAKRVDISDDDDTTASVKSVPVQSVKSNTEPVVKEVKPAAPEIKSEPKPVTETKPTTQTQITTEAIATSESKTALENTTQPKTASEPKPATETTTVAETKPTAQTKTVTEPKPTTQTTTATDPKPTSEPKAAETKPTTKTEPKPAIETKTETKSTTQTITATDSKPTSELNPAETKPTATEPKPAIETKTVTETKTETKPATQITTATEPKRTPEPKPAETKPTATEPKPAIETKTVTETKTETKPATQITTATEPKPTPEPKPAETKPTATEPKPAIETKTVTETKTETKPATQITTATEPKRTPEPKPAETKPTATEPKPAIETKTVTETKTETKPATQITTATEPKRTTEPKPAETKPTATEPKPATETKTVTETKTETKPTTQTTTATESKLEVETKSTTKTTIASDPKPTSEPKPVELKPTKTAETKPAAETKPTSEPKPVTETKPEPEAKSAAQLKPAPESKPEPVPEKSMSDTLISFSTEPASSGQADSGVDLLSQDLLTDNSPLPQTNKAHKTLDLLADDLIPFNTTTTRTSTDYTYSRKTLIEDFKSSDDDFDPISISSDPTKSPQWYSPPKPDSSSDTFNHFQHPVDFVVDAPPDVLVSLAEDVIPIDTKSDWKTDMDRTSTDYTYSRKTLIEDFKSSDDDFDPISISSDPTKSPQWYSPPKPDSSSDTFNHFQHPVDFVADAPPDVLVSLAEDVIPIDTKSDWKTDMDSYKTSMKRVGSSVQESLPESESKKNFVYVKEYVNNSRLDGSSSDYVSSTTSNYSYSSPSYSSRGDMTPCTYCGEMVGNDAKITIEHLNISCHPSCFKCAICSKPMGDLLYNMFLHRGTVHCESCYSNVL